MIFFFLGKSHLEVLLCWSIHYSLPMEMHIPQFLNFSFRIVFFIIIYYTCCVWAPLFHVFQGNKRTIFEELNWICVRASMRNMVFFFYVLFCVTKPSEHIKNCTGVSPFRYIYIYSFTSTIIGHSGQRGVRGCPLWLVLHEASSWSWLLITNRRI